MYREGSFSKKKKNLHRWAKHGFQSLKNNGVEIHRLSGHEKVSGISVSKEGHVNTLLRYITNDFLEKIKL